MLMFMGVACVLIVMAIAVTTMLMGAIMQEYRSVTDDRADPCPSPVHRLRERILLRWDTTRRLR